jgi:small multidrug resistance pump
MAKCYIFLFISIVFNTLANFTLKAFVSNQPRTGMEILGNVFFYLAIFFFGTNFIFYTFALQSIKISIAYPIVVGMSILLLLTLSFVFLSEKLQIIQLIGISLIIAGVVLIFSKMNQPL